MINKPIVSTHASGDKFTFSALSRQLYLVLLLCAMFISGCGGGSSVNSNSTLDINDAVEVRNGKKYYCKSGVCVAASDYWQHPGYYCHDRGYCFDTSGDNAFIFESHQTLGLELMNAEAAYERGYTGDGVTIGQYEWTIDGTHPELAGVLVPDPKSERIDEPWSNITATEAEWRSHAQAVAAVAAARRNGLSEQGYGMHGIAYDAKVHFISDRNEEFESHPDVFADHTAMAIEYLNQKAPIAMSSSGDSDYSLTYTREELEKFRDQLVNALLQPGTPKSEKTIWVFASGNDGKLYPTGLSQFGIFFPEMHDHVLAIVGLGKDGVIEPHSNICGDAHPYCIAAPWYHRVPLTRELYTEQNGEVTDEWWEANPQYEEVGGTSYATPAVAGSLAILKQAFPDIGHDELVQRLFATANKSGIYANKEIYGQGLVDLDRATRPVGQTSIAMGATVEGASASSATSIVETGGASGDSAMSGFANRSLMLLDALNTPFYVPLDTLASTYDENDLDQRIDGLIDRLLATDETGSTVPWLKIAGEPVSTQKDISETQFRLYSFSVSDFSDTFGFSAENIIQKSDTHRLSYSVGALIEEQSLLGVTTDGAFGETSAESVMVGISSSWQLNDWNLSASASLGLSTPHVTEGLIEDADASLASTFSLEARQRRGRRDIWVGLSQPLRFESGSMQVSYPSGRTPGGEVLTDTFDMGLAPSGRQLDLELGVTYRTGQTSSLGVVTWISTEPGHIETQSPEVGVALAYQKRF